MNLGQYYPADSLVHKLDARLKFLMFIITITQMFFLDGFISYLFLYLFLWFIVRISKVPFKLMIRKCKGIFMLIIFTALLNMFFVSGNDIIFSFFIFRLTYEGLRLTALMILRIVFLIIFSSLLTLTTTPMAIVNAIVHLLRPFNKIGLPTQEIAMITSIALRFIPVLFNEFEIVKMAQMSRGVDFHSKNLFSNIKNLSSLIIPMFVISFRRADELSIAMESRCYNPKNKRTEMSPMHLKKLDWISIGYIVIFFTALNFFNMFLKI